ncbi:MULTISPECIES: PDR/VanB family oxidoreductase [unclassified Variovorax]|uniref:PDR/VanB family oxidoreductase n=1 Tax=unclassified Variovorax TaxID=663243 RepID=UPI00076D93C0|nr:MULTISPECIES: PDR/VanB family oxidoreductase [unclassified Variovorax]KWT97678.1 Flavodoxin reductases (ferredoxin-NADPH reductases) family 1 [Variovorax sp. WDL1]PNG48778.1 Phenoxybenzoate dioxygenase subunit beta [Variovorax sp. B2]PNG49285.1 Phenoxybenzoate dioxygenase subunit beta [Variovorax sp. B4]VTV18445.1 Phenoxybenzoate dioxygenase subunit beta [Variovorax sp. WDL1]
MQNRSNLLVRVARKQFEASGIQTFEFVAATGGILPPFSAGSHIEVHLPGGITRSYSLFNDPSEGHRYLISVLRTVTSRGGSSAMHELVNEGDVLEISAPRNHFALASDARRHLLIAGGIGVTPILCMAQRLAALQSSFDLHYCTRSVESTAFRALIAASPALGKNVSFHFDDGAPEQQLDLKALLHPEQGTHLYVCGPAGFMEAVLSTARLQGWDEAALHYEYFSAGDAMAGPGSAFDVQLASSGRVIKVDSNLTVVQALQAAGVGITVSCEQGICGACLTRVIEGIPDHRDFYLTPDEQAANDQFTPCCSRAKSARLVLDL